MSETTHERRWYQFSLKTLLVVTTVSIVTFGGWIQYMRHRAQVNRDRVAPIKEAVAKIHDLGGTVLVGASYSSSGTDLPVFSGYPTQSWLEEQFDDPGGPRDFNVTDFWGVSLQEVEDADGVLEHLSDHLERMIGLWYLSLYGIDVSDVGLAHLKGLTTLLHLYLGNTKVTDASLEHLKGHKFLRILDLDNTNVTDAGLEHLRPLKNLTFLGLRQTKVTDEGVEKLQQSLPNCQISH